MEQRLIQRSMEDEDFRRKLLEDAKRAVERELGRRLPEGVSVADANQWLPGAEYEALRARLEASHAAAETAIIGARRRVRINEGG